MGEDVIVARAGKPIAKISAIRPERPNREPGWAKGKIWIAPDFDAPMSEEELALWYDGEIFPK
jgi:antitoxin (DNA-binding transcriptional repressor) of toxin-antitoxin stability system